MKITFPGAADSVTGSRHLVEAGRARVLPDSAHLQEKDAPRSIRGGRTVPVPQHGAAVEV
jgi:hypothetical protein